MSVAASLDWNIPNDTLRLDSFQELVNSGSDSGTRQQSLHTPCKYD
jgi:hypothetical protein